eukprot:1150752-Pelagomonas_calceolata.AAC.4
MQRLCHRTLALPETAGEKGSLPTVQPRVVSFDVIANERQEYCECLFNELFDHMSACQGGMMELSGSVSGSFFAEGSSTNSALKFAVDKGLNA